MVKRHWLDRMLTFAFLAVAVLILSTFFWAPLSLDEGELPTLGIDGRANVIDRTSYYEDLPPLQKAAYWFGDFNCHNNNSRSYSLNGNQMPMCSRDLGIFTGASIGLLGALLFATPFPTVRETFFAPFPRVIRQRVLSETKWLVAFALILVVLFIGPIAWDGITQSILGLRVSFNTLRVTTGILFGVLVAYFVGSFCNSFLSALRNEGAPHEKDPDAEQVEWDHPLLGTTRLPYSISWVVYEPVIGDPPGDRPGLDAEIKKGASFRQIRFKPTGFSFGFSRKTVIFYVPPGQRLDSLDQNDRAVSSILSFVSLYGITTAALAAFEQERGGTDVTSQVLAILDHHPSWLEVALKVGKDHQT